MKIVLIAAVARNYVIGNRGRLPWCDQEEINHFKTTTWNHPVIVGRKTYFGLSKPLKGRLNIVLTKSANLNVSKEVKVFHSMNSAFDFCGTEKYDKIFICGGGAIYRESISICDEMIISMMNFAAEGDILFPRIGKEWKGTNLKIAKNFTVVKYNRR